MKCLGFKNSIISKVFKTISLASSIFLIAIVLAIEYSVQGGEAQIISKY